MFRQYCDESGYCSYVECEDGDEDCIYTCDTMGRCYQICEDGDEDCGSNFWGYYSSQVSDGNGGVLDAVTDERPWVRASYLGGILLVLLALLAFAVRFAVSKVSSVERLACFGLQGANCQCSILARERSHKMLEQNIH